MGATIRDVAKLAQVSPATVSRYFSGSAVVGTERSKRIEDAAEQLGYVPVRTAIKRNQDTIIVLLPQTVQGYFSEVIKEIFHQLPKHKCKILVLPIVPGDDSYKSYFNDLYIRGVIYLDENIDPDTLRYIRAKNVRVVMLGGAAYDSRCDSVHVNDMAAAYEGMRYLLSLDHREFLILADCSRAISSGAQRLLGCQQALKAHHVPYDEEQMVEYTELTYDGAYQAVKRALKKGKKFTAVFAFSDECAVSAISALAEHGLRVPEDVSVLGFDGIPLSGWIVPQLTTIYQPIDKMVEWTLNTLCAMDGKKQTENMDYTLPYKLLKRGTCRKREETT